MISAKRIGPIKAINSPFWLNLEYLISSQKREKEISDKILSKDDEIVF